MGTSKLKERGQGIVQVLIAAAILSTLMLAAMEFFSNQTKANNFLEFQSKREQLRATMLSQFLNNPDNCKCLFAGSAPFATPGPSDLTGVTPTQIGRYQFVTPGTCAGATVPAPFVTSTGLDGLKATSIQLKNILNISGSYSGDLVVNLQSTKDVLGPKDIALKIPVTVATTPAGGGMVSFVSCSASASAGGGGALTPALGLCASGLLSAGYDPTTGALVCQPPTYQ